MEGDDCISHQRQKKMVVGTGFEPVKALAGRFTVCPRWPLEYPTSLNVGRIVSHAFRPRSSSKFGLFFRLSGPASSLSQSARPHLYPLPRGEDFFVRAYKLLVCLSFRSRHGLFSQMRDRSNDAYWQSRWERFSLSLEERAGVRTVVPQTLLHLVKKSG